MYDGVGVVVEAVICLCVPRQAGGTMIYAAIVSPRPLFNAPALPHGSQHFASSLPYAPSAPSTRLVVPRDTWDVYVVVLWRTRGARANALVRYTGDAIDKRKTREIHRVVGFGGRVYRDYAARSLPRGLTVRQASRTSPIRSLPRSGGGRYAYLRREEMMREMRTRA